jgi:nitrate reductase beta subunit
MFCPTCETEHEFRREERVTGKTDPSIVEGVGLSVEDARQMHRLLALAFYHERFVVPTTHRERTANAPYIERGFTGFGEMAPTAEPRRRSTFYSGRTEVGS